MDKPTKPAPSQRLLTIFANDLYVIEGHDDCGGNRVRTEECEGAYIIRAVNAHDELVKVVREEWSMLLEDIKQDHETLGEPKAGQPYQRERLKSLRAALLAAGEIL